MIELRALLEDDVRDRCCGRISVPKGCFPDRAAMWHGWQPGGCPTPATARENCIVTNVLQNFG
jgi:hypothetical protein